MIHLQHASVEYTDGGCVTRFHIDGAEIASHPHQTHHYHVVAHRCGYADDIMRYCREHDVVHSVAAEFFYRRTSPVLWQLAHGSDVSAADAAHEEAMVTTIQRFLRTGERPLIGRINWDALLKLCHEKLDK